MTTTQPRVLLIEDGATYAKLATVLLQRCECQVTRAATAAEGLRVARERPPDLVLLDIHLPDQDGFHTVRDLREDERIRKLPVVGMTAARIESDDERRAARAAGFDAYVEKPTDERTFRALLDRILVRSRVAR
jgi:two-component system cell cycle response regulator DivK